MLQIADYANRLFHSKYAWIGIGACLAFWTTAYFTPFTPVYVVVNVIFLALSISVSLSYFAGFLEALIAGELREGEQLVMGIWLAWFGDSLLRIWAMTQRGLGYPDWMVGSDIVSFLIFIKLMGATLHMAAPGAVEGEVPRTIWIRLGIAFTLGAAFAALILATSMGAGLVKTE